MVNNTYDTSAAGSGNVVNSHHDTSIIHLKQEEAHVNFTYPDLELSTGDAPHHPVTKDSKHILVLGSGVSGLLAAWMLLDKGYRVTVIADDWAWTRDFNKSRMTSQIAGALWEFPPGGCGMTEIEDTKDGWSKVGDYQNWATQSFDFYNQYDKVQNDFEKHGHSLGLQMTNLHQFFYENIVSAGSEGEEAIKFQKLEGVDEKHPDLKLHIKTFDSANKIDTHFPNVNNKSGKQQFTSAYTHRAPIINTDKAMAYLMALVTTKGASLETRKLDGTIRAIGAQLLADHKADGIVNATGLAARHLADDADVYPVRGAVKRIDNTRTGQFRHLNDAYLVPAQKDGLGHPIKTIFIVPRSDDVLYVGSIIQPNIYDKTLTPDSPEVQVMWNRAGDFMPKLLQANPIPTYPFAQGLRPFTKRNAKIRADEEADFPLVHNYGHGGSGWTLGIGTARCAVTILEGLLAVLGKDGEGGVKAKAATINESLYGKRI